MGKPKKGRPRTYTDEKVADLWEQGYNDKEISEILGVSTSTVRDKRAKAGLVNGYPITQRYLEESGIGDAWDKTCKMIRKAAGWA